MNRLPALFKTTKSGQTQFWQVETEGETVGTIYGKVGGEPLYSSFKVEPKNIGRSNATSPEEQAEFEALALWKKKKDKGYYETIPEATKAAGNELLPMLAHPIDKARNLQYPFSIQPKLDGVRALAVKEEGRVRLITRGNKTWDCVPHINCQLEQLMDDGDILDGELYIHGVPLQTIASYVKKTRKESLQVEYWVYDFPSVDDYWPQRLEALFTLCGKAAIPNIGTSGCSAPTAGNLPLHYNIYLLETATCEVEEDLFAHVERHRVAGFEGSIVRTHDGLYEFNYRSYGLLKVKHWVDDDFTIIDIIDGKGKFEGCAILECVTKGGKVFKATPAFTQEEKQEIFENKEEYIGCLATVRYAYLTKEGKPFHTRALAIRPREDVLNG